jgi:CheY-like chemotaxis protein
MRAMLQRLIGEDIKFFVNLTSDLRAILADRAQLEQVVMNLVVNARDAMPKGGTLTIETRLADAAEVAGVLYREVETGDYLKLTVTDTGIGMDAEIQTRIFEPFFTTKATGHGTGLGLATVYGVVQQLGGHITVSSQPGHGAMFTLYFPAIVEPAVPAPMPVRSSALVAERREVVLVVEDQPAVRQLTSRVLTRHGYSVLEAASAGEALTIVEGHPGDVDLVVSDVVMPTMDGPEMVAILKKLRPHVKVLYMSGYAGDAIALRGGLDLTDTILEKPFTASVLLRAVREALGSRPRSEPTRAPSS